MLNYLTFAKMPHLSDLLKLIDLFCSKMLEQLKILVVSAGGAGVLGSRQ